MRLSPGPMGPDASGPFVFWATDTLLLQRVVFLYYPSWYSHPHS
jgi:hypothetical protein